MRVIGRRSIKTRLDYFSHHTIYRITVYAAITQTMSAMMLYIIYIIYIHKTENWGVRFAYINIVKRVLSGKFRTRAPPRGLSSRTCNFFCNSFFVVIILVFFFFFDVLPSSASKYYYYYMYICIKIYKFHGVIRLWTFR